jgi:hypothetical protein
VFSIGSAIGLAVVWIVSIRHGCVITAALAGKGIIAMAKGQMRSSKEKKKPKADHNKKKKGGAAPSAAQPQTTAQAFAKKS